MKTTKNLLIIVVLVLGCAFIFQTYRTSVKSQKIELYERNMVIAKDSIQTLALRNGQLLVERDAYVLSMEQMADQIGLSDKEIKELRRKLGSALATITQLESNIRVDSVVIPGEVIKDDDDVVEMAFKHDAEWVDIDGRFRYEKQTGYSELDLDRIELPVPVTVGMTEDMQFFVTTPNPYVSFDDVVSTVNIKEIQKKRRWRFGLNVGPGIYYDAIHNTFAAGIGLQLGINFNF